MDVYDFEVLKKVVSKLNDINSNIMLVKQNVASKANGVGYNNISSLLRTQIKKLENVEEKLDQYASGIVKIYEGSLDNVEIEEKVVKKENKETDLFLKDLKKNKNSIKSFINKKFPLNSLADGEKIFLLPNDIAECENNILKNMGFESSDRKKLTNLMFKKRNVEEEKEYQSIVKNNKNVKVSAETLEAGLFDLFNSIKQDYPFEYMNKVNEEYKYTDDLDDKNIFIKGEEYSYEDFYENYADGDLGKHQDYKEYFGSQEGTVCRIIKDQVVLKNNSFMKSKLKEYGNNGFFHSIKKVNQSDWEYLNIKYSNLLKTNDEVGKWTYIGEVPQEVIDGGIALLKDEYKERYRNLIDSEYEEDRQTAYDALTNLYINSIIFKENLTDEEMVYLSNSTNEKQTALAIETRNNIYDIEFGNQFVSKYEDVITSMNFQYPELTKILLFNKDRTESETEFLKGVYSNEYMVESLDENGNKISVPIASALDFEEYILASENSSVKFDYENNKIIVISKKYGSFDDYINEKYGLSDRVNVDISEKSYNIKVDVLTKTLINVNTEDASFEGAKEIIDSVDVGLLSNVVDISDLYSVYGNKLNEVYGITENDFNNMFDKNIVTKNGYNTDDIVINIILDLKRKNIKLSEELLSKINSYNGSLNIENIASGGGVVDTIGALTSDIQIVGLKTLEGAASWGEHIGDSAISVGMLFEGSLLDKKAQGISDSIVDSIEESVGMSFDKYILTCCGKDGLTSLKIYDMVESSVFSKLNIPEVYNGVNVKDLLKTSLGKEKDEETASLYKNIKNEDGVSLEYIENIILYGLDDYKEYMADEINKSINYDEIYDSEKVNNRNEKLNKIAEANVAMWFNDKVWNTEYGKWIDEHSVMGGKEGIVAQAAQSAGNNLPSIAIRLGLSMILSPVAGETAGKIANAAAELSFFLSSYGASASEAVNKGVTDPIKLNVYSTLSAGLEMFTEHFSPGGVVTEHTVIGSLLEKSNLSNITKIIISAAGESEEEVFGWILSPFVEYMSGITDNDLSECLKEGYNIDELGQTIASAFLSSLMLQGVSGIGQIINRNNYDIVMSYDDLNVEQKNVITEEEFNQVVEDFNKSSKSIRKLVFEKLNETDLISAEKQEVIQALMCIASGVTIENAYKSLSESAKKYMDFDSFKSVQESNLEFIGNKEISQINELSNYEIKFDRLNRESYDKTLNEYLEKIEELKSKFGDKSDLIDKIAEQGKQKIEEEYVAAIKKDFSDYVERTINDIKNKENLYLDKFDINNKLDRMVNFDNQRFNELFKTFAANNLSKLYDFVSLEIDKKINEIKLSDNYKDNYEKIKDLNNYLKLVAYRYYRNNSKMLQYVEQVRPFLQSAIETYVRTRIEQNVIYNVFDGKSFEEIASELDKDIDLCGVNHVYVKGIDTIIDQVKTDAKKAAYAKIEQLYGQFTKRLEIIKGLVQENVDLNDDALYLIRSNGKRIVLTGDCFVEKLYLAEIDIDSSTEIEKTSLDFRNQTTDNFFSKMSETYGMNQGIFRETYKYSVTDGFKKYMPMIIEGLKHKINSPLYYDFIDRLEGNGQVLDMLMNKIKEVLIDNGYSSSEIHNFVKENFTLVRDRSYDDMLRMRQKLIDIGFDVQDATDAMAMIDTSGVCTYAAMGNAIYDFFKDMPEAFEKHFGFPMFNEYGKLNQRELLLDMYFEINKTSNGGKLFDDSGTKIKLLSTDESNLIRLGEMDSAIVEDHVRNYLASKGIKIEFENGLSKSGRTLVDEVATAFVNNEQIIVDCSDIYTVYSFKGERYNKRDDGGHAMYIIGIEDGNIIVDSWGQRRYLKPNELTVCCVGQIKFSLEESVDVNVDNANEHNSVEGVEKNNLEMLSNQAISELSDFEIKFDAVDKESYDKVLNEYLKKIDDLKSKFGDKSELIDKIAEQGKQKIEDEFSKLIENEISDYVQNCTLLEDAIVNKWCFDDKIIEVKQKMGAEFEEIINSISSKQFEILQKRIEIKCENDLLLKRQSLQKYMARLKKNYDDTVAIDSISSDLREYISIVAEVFYNEADLYLEPIIPGLREFIESKLLYEMTSQVDEMVWSKNTNDEIREKFAQTLDKTLEKIYLNGFFFTKEKLAVQEKIKKNLNINYNNMCFYILVSCAERTKELNSIIKNVQGKFNQESDELYLFETSDGKKVLKGRNIIEYLFRNKIKSDIDFQKLEISDIDKSETRDFFLKTGETFGMDQGVFRQVFKYHISNQKDFIQKYREIILNGVKERFGDDLVVVIAEFLDGKIDCHQIGYNFIRDILIANNYKGSELKQIMHNLLVRTKSDYNVNVVRLMDKLINMGFDAQEAVDTIKMIDLDGVCSYASLGNALYDYFKDTPELFEKHFGFSMFDEDGKLNQGELLLDMYVEINKKSNGGKLFDDTGNNIKVLSFNDAEAIKLGRGDQPLVVAPIRNYLHSKGININIQENHIDNHKLSPIEEISSAFAGNDSVKIGAYSGVNIYKPDGSFVALSGNDGHAMYVVGIENDRIIVCSWGKKCYIKLDDLKNNNYNLATMMFSLDN